MDWRCAREQRSHLRHSVRFSIIINPPPPSTLIFVAHFQLGVHFFVILSLSIPAPRICLLTYIYIYIYLRGGGLFSALALPLQHVFVEMCTCCPASPPFPHTMNTFANTTTTEMPTFTPDTHTHTRAILLQHTRCLPLASTHLSATLFTKGTASSWCCVQ